MYKEERDVLEEDMREIDECDMEEIGTLLIDGSEKTIAILLRGTIVNRTYGIHKNLYIYPFLLTIFGPINYVPP